jgi:DNA (cytosine-5)-methyltransferase 1
MIDGQILSMLVQPIEMPSQKLDEIIEKNGVDEKYFVNGSFDKFGILKGNKKIRRINPEGEIYLYSEGAMAFPDPIDKPARTMLTSEGSLNRSTHVIIDPKLNLPRLLTPLECERLNGFDDNWTDTGMPHKFRYFCMGNALVVPIIEIIGKRFIEIWGKTDVN